MLAHKIAIVSLAKEEEVDLVLKVLNCARETMEDEWVGELD